MNTSKPLDFISATLLKMAGMGEGSKVKGRYRFRCYDKNGVLKWEDTIDNLVTTVGKNLELDTLLAGSAYSVTGPYMGLSGAETTGPAVGDTMASHAGWTEAGPTQTPDYSGTRKTAVFNAAAAGVKDLSADLSFTFTEGGTVYGAFIVLGTGATSAKENTGGVLYSIGDFTGGDKTVANTDVLNIDWQVTLT